MMEIGMEKKEVLNPGSNTEILCLEGTVWVTWYRGSDVFLREGDRFASNGLKRVLVQAVAGAARIGLQPAAITGNRPARTGRTVPAHPDGNVAPGEA